MLRNPKAFRYLAGMNRIILICILGLFFSSCKKEPGEGGQAIIQGKIFVQEYNANCAELRGEYYGIDEEVYIIAGDDPSYFERVRTGPDGTYWFPYLRKGDYRIYALSDDCEPTTDQMNTVEVQTTIEERKQTIILEDIVVIR